MKLNTQMNSQQIAQVKSTVNKYNNQLKAQGLKVKKDLGQDKYLKLLVTQLRYQDPTDPVKNHSFRSISVSRSLFAPQGMSLIPL